MVVGKNNSVDYSALSYKIKPTGSFYAEVVQDAVEQHDSMADINYTQRTVTISTTDEIMGKIFRDDIVLYDGRFWRVASITLQKEWKRTQFMRNSTDGKKIIVLRG